MTQIPEQMVDRLAAEIARRSGHDQERHPNDSIMGHYRETAKSYLRTAMGIAPDFDLPGEVTFNTDTNEIRGSDDNWYEVPQPVVIRYMFAVGFAGANLTEFGHANMNDEQLDKLGEILYGLVYTIGDATHKKTIRHGLRLAIQEAMK